MGTAIFIGSRRAAAAVGSRVVDAVTSAIFSAFAVLVQFAILKDFAICVNGCAILIMLDVLFRQPLTLHVSLDPEVGEEDEKQGSIHPNEVNDYRELVVTAVHKVPLGGMERHQNELNLFGEEISGEPCT